MYTLRRVSPDYGQINTNIGDWYSLVLREKNEAQFNESTKNFLEDSRKLMYGIVLFDDDDQTIMPLYKDSEYYIMTSDGRTFDNISQK